MLVDTCMSACPAAVPAIGFLPMCRWPLGRPPAAAPPPLLPPLSSPPHLAIRQLLLSPSTSPLQPHIRAAGVQGPQRLRKLHGAVPAAAGAVHNARGVQAVSGLTAMACRGPLPPLPLLPGRLASASQAGTALPGTEAVRPTQASPAALSPAGGAPLRSPTWSSPTTPS